MIGMAVMSRREALYQALVELGPGFHARKEIAAHLGKKRLNPGEVADLDTLSEAGRIDKQEFPTNRPLVHEWRYAIKDTTK